MRAWSMPVSESWFWWGMGSMSFEMKSDLGGALFRDGVALHQQGQLGPTREVYEPVLSQHPQCDVALHLLGEGFDATSGGVSGINL